MIFLKKSLLNFRKNGDFFWIFASVNSTRISDFFGKKSVIFSISQNRKNNSLILTPEIDHTNVAFF